MHCILSGVCVPLFEENSYRVLLYLQGFAIRLQGNMFHYVPATTFLLKISSLQLNTNFNHIKSNKKK